VERKILETIVCECSDCFAGNATSPESLAYPVAKLGCVPMDVFTNPNSDSTGCRSLDLDAKVCCQLRTRCALKKLLRIVHTVWMRKQIAQAQPDLAVVGMFGK
jgi:hypothetical protein